ncbi:hypothetical protein BBJ28_00020013 [Nothophytophthora sp. Chile5]|nr:hypothetical protein BBJ28_00020013 [Nothophytophthora sp. Chile5]
MMAEHEDGDGAPPQLLDADRGQRAQISDYTLLEFLGEGATAQVYLAEHGASGDRVAIKVIDKLLVQRAQLEGKVRQEMVLHTELHHPFVLQVQDPALRPPAEQILLHPWLREQAHKRPTTPSNRRKAVSSASTRAQQSTAPRQRDPLRSPTKRKSRKVAALSSTDDEPLRTSRVAVALKAPPKKRNALVNSRIVSERRRSREGGGADGMDYAWGQALPPAGVGNSSSSSDDSSVDFVNEEFSDLSELSMPVAFKSQHGEETKDQAEEPHLHVFKSADVRPMKSVVMHLELRNLPFLGLSDGDEGLKAAVEWTCEEPLEVGRPPLFKLKVSNGWEAQYDPGTGVLTATSPDGNALKYEIPGVHTTHPGSVSVSVSSRHSTARSGQTARLPALVRFCQCLALRTMQLRRIALRGEACKLPFVHYDTLPESLLASFRYRASLATTAPHSLGQLDVGGGASSIESSTDTRRSTEIPGVGCGYINTTGDLRVVYLDGAQLTLAASGLQLRFRPSWADSQEEDDSDDVFDLLTGSNMSAFLPSAVKQKLESIPEFIRRLKAGS